MSVVAPAVAIEVLDWHDCQQSERVIVPSMSEE
jgi:hypothetical protein